MMKLDRGNKDQSPHNKVRSNHDLDFRKNRMLWTSFLMTLCPSILFLVFWSDREDIRTWEFTIMTIASGLMVLGSLWNLTSFFVLNKDTRGNNIISSTLLFLGGLLYLVGAIGIAEDLRDGSDNFFTKNVKPLIGNNETQAHDGINLKDCIYWFGLFSLIAFNAIMLSIDIFSDIFFAQYLRISMWAWPMLFSSSFVWGVLLCYNRRDLSWWEVCGSAGFGVIAITSLLIMLAACVKVLVKSLGTFLAFCSFLGSVAVWIYFGAIIDLYATDASDALFYIAIPWIYSAQSLFLMYDCFLGTKEPKDGAAANTVHHNSNNPANRNVNVPVS